MTAGITDVMGEFILTTIRTFVDRFALQRIVRAAHVPPRRRYLFFWDCHNSLSIRLKRIQDARLLSQKARAGQQEWGVYAFSFLFSMLSGQQMDFFL